MIRISFVILMFFTVNVSSQSFLEGRIIDENNNGLPFANVILLNSDSTLIKADISDELGYFNIQSSDEVSFLNVSFLGFSDRVIDIDSLESSEPIVLYSDTQLMEEVTITAQKSLIQRMGDRVIMNVDNSLFASGSNTLELLRKAPNVILDQDDNISINGRNGVRIYIDGKDTRLGGSQLTNLLEGMNAEGIERIEVITNPSSKYEAQGNAGIIDIITKKGKLFGTNGTATFNAGAGHYFRWDNHISINHRNEKYNLYGSYSFANRDQYMEIIIDRKFFNSENGSNQIDMYSLFQLPIENHNPRVGLDLYINEKLTAGLSLSSFSNITGQNAFNEINATDYNGSFQLNQTTDTDSRSNWNQYNGNIYLDYSINQIHKIVVNLDRFKYNYNTIENFASNFFDMNDSLLTQSELDGNVDGKLDLRGISVDYTLNLKSTSKLELGIKATHVNSDNRLEYFDKIDDNIIMNQNLSNHFLYDERIKAIYSNYSLSKGKFSYSLGLRLEDTKVLGEQITTSEEFSQDYLNIFPSSSITYHHNDNHIFGLSFSRRLDRPGYNDLNPFRFFVNSFTYRVGNPFLIPQFTWSTELSYTLFQRYNFSMSYARIVNNLNNGIFQEEGEDYVVVKPINIGSLNSMSVSVSIPFEISDRWSVQLNANASFNNFKGIIGGFEFERVNPIYVINMNNTLNLGKGFTLQSHVFYLPSHYVSISRIEDISQLFVGIQKKLMNDKATLGFNMHDVFYQGYPVGRTIHGNLDDSFISKRDTRYGTVSFSYNFGKQSVRPARRRASSVQEELNRARQSNS